MVNAWSLLYSQMNGTIDEDYPIMSKDEEVTSVGGGNTARTGEEFFIEDFSIDGYVSADFPTGNLYAADTVSFDLFGGGEDSLCFTGDIEFRTDGYPGTVEDALTFSGYDTIGFGDSEIEKPKPNLKYKSQKYGEDKGIADLKDYVSSTYQGHYTNESSDVQTLDLIHSVGDAESFCRSNALKYLSRYDKKGQAKRDILKAMHYCLLLYYFSGQTNNEITTHGYETF